MPVYAALITGSYHLEHDEGGSFDLGVCTVVYVSARNEALAKQRSVESFLKNAKFGGVVSNPKLNVDKIHKTRIWALWSPTSYWGWDASDPDKFKLKENAVKTALEWHRYIK